MKPYLLIAITVLTSCSTKKHVENTISETTPDDTANTLTIQNTAKGSFSIAHISHDSLLSLIYQDELPDTVSALTIQQDAYSNGDGSCANGELVIIRRATENDEERFDLVWAQLDDEGAAAFSSVVSFDNTAYQGESSIDLTTFYPLSENCSTLAVTQEYEGGDIDLTRTKTTSFYAVSEGSISEILTVAEEDTRISEYYNTGKVNENTSITIAELEVLSSSNNGYRDVKIVYTNIENTDTTSSEKVLRYKNGAYEE